MKKRLVLMAFLLQVAAVSLFAQSKPHAGDTISGVVRDSLGPMMMVNVTERDTSDRIVAHTITHMDGYFSFRLVNPDDRIRISYVGYETVNIPIDTTFFEIKMKEQDDLPPIEIIPDRRQEAIGPPIPMPLRDIQ